MPEQCHSFRNNWEKRWSTISLTEFYSDFDHQNVTIMLLSRSEQLTIRILSCVYAYWWIKGGEKEEQKDRQQDKQIRQNN
jgi:hypothetical protein